MKSCPGTHEKSEVIGYYSLCLSRLTSDGFRDEQEVIPTVFDLPPQESDYIRASNQDLFSSRDRTHSPARFPHRLSQQPCLFPREELEQ